MAEYTALSGKIKVFPASRRVGSADPFSRLMSESTITSIVNRLISSDGFVITHYESNYEISGLFEFNIFGYYIRVDDIEDVLDAFDDYTSIYASIELDDTATSGLHYLQIVGIDDTNYTGVKFTDTARTGTNIHCIKLFERTTTSSNWEVPDESYIIFSKDNLSLYDIDGGEIQ